MLLVWWSSHPDRHLTPIPIKEAGSDGPDSVTVHPSHPTFTSFTKSASHLTITELSHLVRDKDQTSATLMWCFRSVPHDGINFKSGHAHFQSQIGITKPTKQVIGS